MKSSRWTWVLTKKKRRELQRWMPGMPKRLLLLRVPWVRCFIFHLILLSFLFRFTKKHLRRTEPILEVLRRLDASETGSSAPKLRMTGSTGSGCSMSLRNTPTRAIGEADLQLDSWDVPRVCWDVTWQGEFDMWIWWLDFSRCSSLEKSQQLRSSWSGSICWLWCGVFISPVTEIMKDHDIFVCFRY